MSPHKKYVALGEHHATNTAISTLAWQVIGNTRAQLIVTVEFSFSGGGACRAWGWCARSFFRAFYPPV